MSMPVSRETLTAIVTGRVQRVGFRQFCQAHAQQLGLVGFARNDDDGTVEVVASGPRPALDQFVTSIQKGNVLIQVTRMHLAWGPRADLPTTFEIR